MPLSEDQRALLRLLLAGDSYNQIAAVLGTSPSEVRDRAHRAAGGMDETLDGRSAEEVRERLKTLDAVSSAEAPPAQRVAPAGRQPVPRALWLAGAALVIAVAVLGITQLGGDGDDAPQATPPDQEDVVSVKLKPVGGSRASGTAAIVRVADLPAIDLDVRRLTPSLPGETYVLWLLGSGGRGLPVAFRQVGSDGLFTGRTEIPSSAAGLFPSFEQVELSVVSNREAASVLQEAARSRTLPQHIGNTVLRGALRG